MELYKWIPPKKERISSKLTLSNNSLRVVTEKYFCLTLLYCWHLRIIWTTVNAQLQEGHCGGSSCYGQCSRKRGQPLKKRKKSCFLDFEKNVKKRTQFHRPLSLQLLNYRKSVPVSHGHQHQTSCSEVWTQESMQLRTVCDKSHNIREFWGQNFYRHSANLILGCDFLRLSDTSFQKNVKSHVFFKSEKKRKIRILEHWM